jgi:hypothetical protein
MVAAGLTRRCLFSVLCSLNPHARKLHKRQVAGLDSWLDLVVTARRPHPAPFRTRP